MKISLNGKGYVSQLGFGAGQSVLYSDFDGTFLAQPLHDVFSYNTRKRSAGVENFNKYFSQIQDFIDETKGKFEIIITTGRRLFGDRKEGFENTYQEMRDYGIKFPKIKSIITSEGGDIHHFRVDGSIDRTPDPQKAKAVKEACGWDNAQIKAALDDVAQQTGVGYRFVDHRGSYKLSIALDDTSKTEDFYSRLISALEGKMQINSTIGKVKTYNKLDDFYQRVDGIRLEPHIDGSYLHKDFDTKAAIKRVAANNDFLIIAGDADNDREMLNIFNYVRTPDGMKKPERAGQITDEYIRATKDEIEKLPVKIFFIKSGNEDPRVLSLFEFMKEQAGLFPKKVQVVEETQVGQNNHFLDAIKDSITNYASENSCFKKALEDNPEFLKESGIKLTKNHGKRVLAGIALAAVITGIGAYVCRKISKNNAAKNTKNAAPPRQN